MTPAEETCYQAMASRPNNFGLVGVIDSDGNNLLFPVGRGWIREVTAGHIKIELCLTFVELADQSFCVTSGVPVDTCTNSKRDVPSSINGMQSRCNNIYDVLTYRFTEL